MTDSDTFRYRGPRVAGRRALAHRAVIARRTGAARSLAGLATTNVVRMQQDSEDQALHYRIAYENLDEADEIYKALPQTSKRNKRGLANSKKVRGNILRTQEVRHISAK